MADLLAAEGSQENLSKGFGIFHLRTLFKKKTQEDSSNSLDSNPEIEKIIKSLINEGSYISPSKAWQLNALQSYPPSESEVELSQKIQRVCIEAKLDFNSIIKGLKIQDLTAASLKDPLHPKISVAYAPRRIFFKQIAKAINEKLNVEIARLEKKLRKQKCNLDDLFQNHQDAQESLDLIIREIAEERAESKSDTKKIQSFLKEQNDQVLVVKKILEKVDASRTRIGQTLKELLVAESLLIHENEIQAAFAHVKSCPIAA